MIVAGCVAQAENSEMLKREPYIDLIIGPQSYHKINDTIRNYFNQKKVEETNLMLLQNLSILINKNQATKFLHF